MVSFRSLRLSRRSPVRSPKSLRRPPRLETLEDRTVLSTITWVNHGGPGNDSDGFEAAFGAQALAARAVVDTAILAWEQVIAAFNHADPDDNNFQLTVTAEDIGEPTTLADTDDIDTDGTDKPFSAVIRLDDDATGGGWFIDQTPNDNSEFPTLISRSTAMSPTNLGPDMYSVILHELGHAVGLSNDEGGFLEDALCDTGFDDPNDDSEDLLQATGPDVSVTFTTRGGGHTFEGPLPDASLTVHPDDLMNAGLPNDTRRLISELDALILKDFSNLEDPNGYLIELPCNVAEQNFLADLDSTTGVLRVNGDPASLDDQMTIGRAGSHLSVAVNGCVMLFPFAQVQSVVVDTTRTADGTESLTIDYTGGDPVPAGGINYDPGAFGGDRLIIIGPAAATGFDVSEGLVLVNTTDAISYSQVKRLDVMAQAGPDTVVVNGTSCDLFVSTGDGNDYVDLERMMPGTAIGVFGEKDDDTVYLAHDRQDLNGLGGQIDLFGQLGSDSLYVYDQAHGGGDSYAISGDQVTRTGVVISYTGFEALELDAGTGDDHLFVGGGGGLSKVAGISWPVTVHGGAGSDDLRIDASGSTSFTGDRVTITATQVGAASGDVFFGAGGGLTYQSMASLRVDLGKGNDTAIVLSTAATTPVTIYTGRGDNTVYLGSAASPTGQAAPSTVDDIVSGVTVNGVLPAGEDLNSKTKVIVNDVGDSTGDGVTLAGNFWTTNVGTPGDTLFGPGGLLVGKYLTGLELNLGSGGDTVNIRSSVVATTVNGNGGSDEFRVDSNGPAAGGVVNLVQSALTLNGGAGINRLLLDDSGDSTGDQVTLGTDAKNPLIGTVGAGKGDTFFDQAGKGSLRYTGLSLLSLDMGTDADQVLIPVTVPGTLVQINAGPGSDLIQVDSNGPAAPGGTVDSIFSSLTVDGGPGPNTLVLEDSSDLTGDAITVTPQLVWSPAGKPFFGGPAVKLSYANIAFLTLNATRGSDTITVEGTAPGSALSIDAGLGDDTVLIDSNGTAAGGTVDGVLGPVTVDGGPGVNKLTLEDSSDPSGDQVTLTDTRVGAMTTDTFFGPDGTGTVEYKRFATLTLDGGSGGNTINVLSTALKTSVVVTSGTGNDTIHVGSDVAAAGSVKQIRSAVKVAAGAGTDRLTVDGSADHSAAKLTVTGQQVGVAGNTFYGAGDGLTYSGVEDLTINLGGGNDTLVVKGQGKGTVTHVNAGDGNDSITVQVKAQTGYKDVFIDGGAGTDHLTILDLALIGLIKTHKQNGAGWVDVLYQAGKPSRVDFTSIELLTP